MNNTLIIFFCSLFFSFAWGGDTIVSFHGSKIKLPQGFNELSEDQLTIFKATIFNRQILTVYEKKNDKYGLQRIIVYYDSLTGTRNLTFEKIVEIKLEVIKEDGITFDKLKIDESNHCVYGRTIFQGDTSIFGFTVDGFGIMGIQFDNSNGLVRKDYENFEKLITTIKHASQYEYFPEENPKAKEARKEMDRYGLTMTIAFVAMIIIWLIRKYAIKNK